MVSKRVQLYVDFPPTLWITHQLVGVPLGGVATIECLAEAVLGLAGVLPQVLLGHVLDLQPHQAVVVGRGAL